MEDRVRSPRYPSIPLGDAVELARKLYVGDSTHAVDREVAVGHMGYRSLNGASAQVLASLIQYGLIEAAGKGQVRLTSLALDVLEPQSPDDCARALAQAAYSPKLFADLRDRFPNSTPSEGNLRAHLIRQQFQQAALKSVIPAYLQTCEYLAQSGASESHGQRPVHGASSLMNQRAPEPHQMDVLVQQVPATLPLPSSMRSAYGEGSGLRREVFDLDDRGEVVITLPRGLSIENVEDIEAWLDLVVRKLRRTAVAPPTYPSTERMELGDE